MRIRDWSSDVCSSDLVAQAGAHALAAEAAHLEELIEAVLARKGEISRAADALARLDVSAALAERAAEGGWCRPHFEETQCLAIEGGRHPVVEAALAKEGAPFIANDCLRSEEHTSELQSLMRSSYAVLCLKKKKFKSLSKINY